MGGGSSSWGRALPNAWVVKVQVPELQTACAWKAMLERAQVEVEVAAKLVPPHLSLRPCLTLTECPLRHVNL